MHTPSTEQFPEMVVLVVPAQRQVEVVDEHNAL